MIRTLPIDPDAAHFLDGYPQALIVQHLAAIGNITQLVQNEPGDGLVFTLGNVQPQLFIDFGDGNTGGDVESIFIDGSEILVG